MSLAPDHDVGSTIWKGTSGDVRPLNRGVVLYLPIERVRHIDSHHVVIPRNPFTTASSLPSTP